MKLRERSPSLWKQRGYIGIGNRRVMGSMNARRRLEALLDSSTFYAQLTHSLILQRGTGDPSYTRASAATFPDYEGVQRTAIAGEARFVGARRVYNEWTTSSATLEDTANKSLTLAAGTYQFSMGAGTGTATFSGTGGATGTLDATVIGRVGVAKTVTAGTFVVTASVADLADLQVCNITGESDQTTLREYVSVGVLSAPYRGAGVDGVAYFNTDPSGNPISAATLKGYLAEGARTNLLLNSAIVATQNITTSATPYTLSFKGTGTITLSGTSTAGPLVGTGANDRVTLTFTPTAGTLTLTVSGSCTEGQVEAGSFASSYIATAGTAVARVADVLTYPSAGNVDGTKGWAYAEINIPSAAAFPTAIATYTGSGTNGNLMSFNNNAGLTLYDGTATRVLSGPVATLNSVNKLSTSWGGTSAYGSIAGVVSSEAIFDGDLSVGANIGVGCYTNGTGNTFGTVRNVRIGQRALSSSELVAMTL